ncbi:hypothetical protein EUGRSUZ_B01124 [Eucalyptus grandis]|uniref:Uncharacterized protein n=1 Tax=Eucalyptus grandis TaxID=71139 RepID=A0ACC3LPC1_EUCGR|nr:hypothetical protein EUGRSUZ_B01124 [Eucalyptus grandis]
MRVHLCLLLVFSLFQAVQSSTISSITASSPLDQSQTLVSPSQIFELGFFMPNGSRKQYVGIWYKNMPHSKVVWVANRDKPLEDTDQSASLVIGRDGNLKLLDGQQSTVWSTNVTAKSNYSAAVLWDSGNLVLQDRSANEMWQSFDEPTDTLLPNMKIRVNLKTGKTQNLVSWKGEDDPSSGSFVLGITSETPPQGFAWNGSSPYWRSGPWDKSKFIGIPIMNSTYLNNYDLQQNIDQGTSYFYFNNHSNSYFGYFFISSEGSIEFVSWKNGCLWSLQQKKQDDASKLVVYDLDSIRLATDNFDAKNKLGQGGFGLVYKLNDGREIAVKRLSSNSGQGIAELFGCCTEGDEKILVYEYLPNKSLDTFLFDSQEKAKLSWAMRFRIIQGVARGLLYLHRDSYLRVIHRDLKVSNILLDEEMNPKISDFGLAWMFEGTQVLVNTSKVVGTFSYMSPEYAMGGMFSEKSDVYSFGVLMLEIISSKKNTGLDYLGQHLSLLTYAWHLWCEGRGLDLMDEAIANAFSPSEVMRCIQLGLLCVQDHATDRPNMSAVVLMLSGQSDLPEPKQPAITFHSSTTPEVHLQSQEGNILSRNTINITLVEGR